jgi:multifunctional beta-oxidation protein
VTATVMPPEVLENLKPEHVAPVVAWLCHESCKESGQLYETGAGWTGQVRWAPSSSRTIRSLPLLWAGLTCRYIVHADGWQVAARWKEITDFSNPTHPTSQEDSNLMVRSSQRVQQEGESKCTGAS